jgi:exopolyphosphatase/guanosine-5'-triphosphate,3'-diphosphate pyrophosphatase
MNPKGNIAAIDLGTNSFHLLVVRPQLSNYKFRVLDHVKETVRLGSGSTDMKHLSEPAINRAMDTLLRFKKIADAHHATIRAVGTSALREALNRQDFITRVKGETGISVEVVSGFEEARLIYLGVVQALPVYDRKALIIDIGGGSTEFLIGQKRKVLFGNSLKLGAIRITERFFPNGKIKSSAVEECRDYVSGMLSPVVREVKKLGFEIAVGSSGTILNIGSAVMKKTNSSSAPGLNNLTLKKQNILGTISDILSAQEVRKLSAIPGIDPGRLDIISAGAIILEQILLCLQIPEITLSEASLQEGIVWDTMEKKYPTASHHFLSDLRRNTILHCAENFSFEKRHSLHVMFLALRLFDATKKLHGLGPSERELLEYASILHDVGLFISHSQHHRHAYYCIRNAELLGFTENEKAIIANIARYHRKSHPKLKHVGYAEVSPEERTLICKLASLLRIADGLDRSHSSAIKDLSCSLRGSKVICRLIPRLKADIDLEIWGGERKKQLFDETFGKEIEFVADVVIMKGESFRIKNRSKLGLIPLSMLSSSEKENQKY